MAITLTTNQAVLDKVGPDGNATIIATSATIDRYILEAEGVVIAETGIDWIAGDSALTNTYVKILVSSCVASLAARNIIEYDMKNYFNTAIAVTMLNVLEKEFKRNIKELKEFDLNKTIRTVPT